VSILAVNAFPPQALNFGAKVSSREPNCFETKICKCINCDTPFSPGFFPRFAYFSHNLFLSDMTHVSDELLYYTVSSHFMCSSIYVKTNIPLSEYNINVSCLSRAPRIMSFPIRTSTGSWARW
jgi:hypothetical protein